ncbi:GntR family transcriptional regulator [Dubosiella muris]|uniref:GntR family transcriptional regulator n=1 Tax=Dubosiella muris TaxID=3038133 RepID=A0AC61R9U8_9FIRM|nr:GntR family transcriptional regulator [Dubosiella muris]TGY66560.1 GntR family transcriptional regulator [Dubosiella muris]
MQLLINTSSMTPIYEQIADQIKQLIKSGDLKENDPLPSVRALAKDYKISALTVKKAYDVLDDEGFIHTVHGKGSYVAAISLNVVLEEQQKVLEDELEEWISKAQRLGFSKTDLVTMFHLLMEEKYDKSK